MYDPLTSGDVGGPRRRAMNCGGYGLNPRRNAGSSMGGRMCIIVVNDPRPDANSRPSHRAGREKRTRVI